MRDKGKLISWNDDKGYGFIAPFSAAAQVFIHVKAFGQPQSAPRNQPHRYLHGLKRHTGPTARRERDAGWNQIAAAH
jgi:hypothetical protein